MWASVSVFWGDCVLIFGSASTLREQFNDEKAALQQSMGKNSALIAEKEQLVQTLRSEVGIKHTMTQSLIQRSQKQKYYTDALALEQSHLHF